MQYSGLLLELLYRVYTELLLLYILCVHYHCAQRPFVVERHTSNEELYSQLRHTRPSASARWDQYTCDVLKLVSQW